MNNAMDREMMRVGLTGGLGSGKTAAARRFIELGVPVVDADEIAHGLVAPGEPALAEIVAAFGDEILGPDGRLDRANMREKVFRDAMQRRRLEAILHPRVRRELRERSSRFIAPYCVLVVPLLIEAGMLDLVDRVVVVDADEERRVAWVMERSQLDEGEIRRIFAAQASREERLRVADDWLQNEGTLEDLRRKVDTLHARFMRIAPPGRSAV
jgi:dephospho-CoA kinase